MSLDYTAHCPLLAQDDIVRLHSSVRCSGATLNDEAAAVQHVFHKSAQPILTALSHGTTVAQLYKCSAVQPTHVTEIMGLCNTIGALEIDRSLQSRMRLLLKHGRNITFGITYAALAHRHQADLRGLSAAVLQACQALITASILVGTLLGTTLWGMSSTIVTICIWSLVLFVGSIIAHEYGHARMLARNNIPAVVLQRKSNITLLHTRAENEARIALAGPATGLLFLAFCWLALSPLHIVYMTQMVLCISLTHCLSLTPFYADGRSLPYYQRLLRWRSS